MLPPILYHGTSTGYLDQILRGGLDPASSGTGYLCYTDELDTARWHAECMAEWDEGVLERPCEAVIFAIPIVEFDLKGFCRDENFIRLGPSHGRAVGKDKEIRRRHRKRAWTWQELLEFSGAVGYKRSLIVTNSMIIRTDTRSK